MPPSPRRGSIPGRIRMAAEYMEARLNTLVRSMDEATDIRGDPPFGGGKLSRQDWASLVTGDPAFQQQMAARMLFASKEEKDAVGRAISRALGDAMATAAPPTGPTGPPPEMGAAPVATGAAPEPNLAAPDRTLPDPTRPSHALPLTP